METQKIINLLNGSDNENSKFATKNGILLIVNQKVTRDITATPNNDITQVIFKNCAPFKDCRTGINDTFVDYADFNNIAMPMYNLIEYSDNYSDTLGSLWNFKRDEIMQM